MLKPTPLRLFFPGLFTLAIVFAVPFAARATDGVVEINHTCAVQTGCFAGDSAGYPITIDGTAGGSYRLTSNLIVPDEFTSGIVVSTSDIGIDLNNFTIIRSGCEGATTDCTPTSGSGTGIDRTSSSNRGISVKNGSITGMGAYGVLLGDQAGVTGLRVRWSRVDGILVNAGSIVSGNIAYQNGSDGIVATGGSAVSGNTVYQNGALGISASFGSTVSGNTVYRNDGDGISTSSGTIVQRNVVRLNGGYGLNLGSQSAYLENVITGNTTGTVNGGVNMSSNSCNGTTTCP